MSSFFIYLCKREKNKIDIKDEYIVLISLNSIII